MRIFVRQFVLGLILAIAAIQAQTHAALTPQTKDTVVYVSGGVGADEREQLKTLEKDFNLKLLFTLVEGPYVSDVAVVVKNASGKVVLEEQSRGPIFLLKLPPGTYTVEATYDGKKQTRKVTVGKRLSTVQFRWPSKPGVDFPVR
jgi:hypothetical protein